MTSLTFTGDPIASLLTSNYSFGVQEALASTDEQPRGYACLSVEGADSAVFLQGQMTADVTASQVGSCSASALCNPKGRVIASMDIARFGDNQFGLILPHHLLETVKSTLSRYIMRSKVNITLWPTQPLVALLPIAGSPEGLDSTLNDDGVFRCRTSWLPKGDRSWVLTNAPESLDTSSSQPDLSWAQAHVVFGLAPPQAETELQHIPQMLNLDALDGVSMTKGCYTGQEIIARVHHRGSVKRRLRRFITDSSSTTAVGDSVESSSGANAGLVVEIAHDDHNSVGVLAVIKESDFTPESEFRCGGTALKPWPLPYAV